jgi:6-pyruvoyltetrahydropterin/6-carboxytetrahydropterin synthase
MTVHAQLIGVRHNIEVAHRLYETPGKCENIHGHSMWVTMEIQGRVNDRGMLAGIEYGELKKMFRGYLDEQYDHHLVLNAADPFAHPIFTVVRDEEGKFTTAGDQAFLPGLTTLLRDPTTENIADEIAKDMCHTVWECWGDSDALFSMTVQVNETKVNFARTEVGFPGRTAYVK